MIHRAEKTFTGLLSAFESTHMTWFSVIFVMLLLLVHYLLLLLLVRMICWLVVGNCWLSMLSFILDYQTSGAICCSFSVSFCVFSVHPSSLIKYSSTWPAQKGRERGEWRMREREIKEWSTHFTHTCFSFPSSSVLTGQTGQWGSIVHTSSTGNILLEITV